MIVIVLPQYCEKRGISNALENGESARKPYVGRRRAVVSVESVREGDHVGRVTVDVSTSSRGVVLVEVGGVA